MRNISEIIEWFFFGGGGVLATVRNEVFSTGQPCRHGNSIKHQGDCLIYRGVMSVIRKRNSGHISSLWTPQRNSSTTWTVLNILLPYVERQMKMKTPAKCGIHFIVGRQKEQLTRLPGFARSSTSQRAEWKWSDWDDSVDPCSTQGHVHFLNICVLLTRIFTREYSISCFSAYHWGNIWRIYKANDVLMAYFLLQ
jgi:hypothetical protein